ncbi:MAG: tRNA adenosine(34) deaminase TadA [Aminipila sp.]
MNNINDCDNIVRYMRNYMEEALAEAKKAYACGEIPIGAVIEQNGRIVGRGYNQTETLKDPTAHAEMIAIREAAKTLGGWRLLNCNLYVTCEPCSMCTGAMIWARINKVFIGTMDPKGGACGSVFNIAQEKKLNHFIEIETGVMEEECSSIIKNFFRELRNKKSEEFK